VPPSENSLNEAMRAYHNLAADRNVWVDLFCLYCSLYNCVYVVGDE